MKIKKLLATFFCCIIFIQIISPNVANATFCDGPFSVHSDYISKQVFQNGNTQLIGEGDRIVVITDEPASSNVQANTSGPSIECRVSKATVYIPDSSEYYEEIYSNLNKALQANSHATIEGDDKNHCASFFMEVYYTREEADDRYIYYNFTKVSGGFEDRGTTGSDVGENVKVWEQWIDISQSGSNLYNQHFVNTQTDKYTISPSSRSWTYTPPSGWEPVSDAGVGALVAVKYSFILGRGSSSWESNPLEVSLLKTLNWSY